MSGQPEDPEVQDPAQRLQAALDRIAQSMEARVIETQAMQDRAAAPASTDPAVLQRLDSLILQLRDALDDEGPG